MLCGRLSASSAVAGGAVRRFTRVSRSVLALCVGCTTPAWADGLPGVGFTDGSLLLNGSASSSAGSTSTVAPGVVTPTTVSGGGSTGSGLVGAVLDIDGAVILGSQETFVLLNGFAQASQPAGYGGFATINASLATTEFISDPLVLTLPSPAFFAISNEGQQAVTFSAITGSIGSGTLAAGTYSISFFFGATVSKGQTMVEKSLDWTLRLSTSPLTHLPTDLNTDGHIDATDLALLLAAWGTSGADISGNGTTAAEDLAMLLAAWG
jgi:hypothetical protein